MGILTTYLLMMTMYVIQHVQVQFIVDRTDILYVPIAFACSSNRQTLYQTFSGRSIKSGKIRANENHPYNRTDSLSRHVNTTLTSSSVLHRAYVLVDRHVEVGLFLVQ